MTDNLSGEFITIFSAYPCFIISLSFIIAEFLLLASNYRQKKIYGQKNKQLFFLCRQFFLEKFSGMINK
jgi:hypothetical protein